MELSNYFNHLQPLAQVLSQIPLERLLRFAKSPGPVVQTTTEPESAPIIEDLFPPTNQEIEAPSPPVRPPPKTLTTSQCISCLAHNHYIGARGRIKEVIKFYNREGGFTDTVIEKIHDVMEDLITPERDDYSAKADSPVLNQMLRDMQKRGDAIKKGLEAVLLDYENRGVSDLEAVRDDIIDIQKAAWKLILIEKKVASGRIEGESIMSQAFYSHLGHNQ